MEQLGQYGDWLGTRIVIKNSLGIHTEESLVDNLSEAREAELVSKGLGSLRGYCNRNLCSLGR